MLNELTKRHSDRWPVLPLAWKYFPTVCSRLVSALVHKGLKGLWAVGIVYLHDILLSAHASGVPCDGRAK